MYNNSSPVFSYMCVHDVIFDTLALSKLYVMSCYMLYSRMSSKVDMLITCNQPLTQSVFAASTYCLGKHH